MPGINDARAVNLDDIVSLKEFFSQELEGLRKIIDERDRLYSTQFKASETAVNAALMAQQQAVKDAFLAAEKAIAKSERSQEEYNTRSDEYRAQLNSQTQTLMPRSETLSLFKAVDEKFLFVQTAIEQRLEGQRISNEKVFDGFTSDLKSLRESRAQELGSTSQQTTNTGMIIVSIGFVLQLIMMALLIALHFY